MSVYSRNSDLLEDGCDTVLTVCWTALFLCKLQQELIVIHVPSTVKRVAGQKRG
jgi:hypothetical protein